MESLAASDILECLLGQCLHILQTKSIFGRGSLNAQSPRLFYWSRGTMPSLPEGNLSPYWGNPHPSHPPCSPLNTITFPWEQKKACEMDWLEAAAFFSVTTQMTTEPQSKDGTHQQKNLDYSQALTLFGTIDFAFLKFHRNHLSNYWRLRKLFERQIFWLHIDKIQYIFIYTILIFIQLTRFSLHEYDGHWMATLLSRTMFFLLSSKIEILSVFFPDLKRPIIVFWKMSDKHTSGFSW